MATPHVTGAVALLASAYPEADAPALKDAILRGANSDYDLYPVPLDETRLRSPLQVRQLGSCLEDFRGA